jgi:hypothetical protein
VLGGPDLGWGGGKVDLDISRTRLSPATQEWGHERINTNYVKLNGLEFKKVNQNYPAAGIKGVKGSAPG